MDKCNFAISLDCYTWDFVLLFVPDKIWNRVEHNLSESLHNLLPITVLLSLSLVEINGLIIIAPDTLS